jgi:hypothetical protein
LRPQLDELQQRADQIQSLTVAQISLVALNDRQQELDTKFNDLINSITNEIDSETARNEEIQQLSNQIKDIDSKLPEFDENELRRHQDGLVPQLNQRLNNLTSNVERQFVDPQSFELTSQINQISTNINDRLQQIGQQKHQTEIENEWTQQTNSIQDQLHSIERDAEPILRVYADENERQPANDAQNHVQQLALLSERLTQLRPSIATASGWLKNADGFTDNDRQNATDDLNSIDQKLKTDDEIYSLLNNQLSNDLLANEDLIYQYQQLNTDLTALENGFRTQDPTQPSNADEFLLKLQAILIRIQELYQLLSRSSKVKPDEELDSNVLQLRADNLRTDIEQQQSLKQLEASELEKEVDKLKEQIEEKIREASTILLDSSASIDQLQQAANILDTVQSKLLTLKQLHNSQQEVQTAENAALRRKLALIAPELQQKWLLKRRQINLRMEDLLRELGQRLAHLVSEGQQLLADTGVHPDQFNEHANRLRVLIRETEAIVSSAAETSVGIDYNAADSLLATIDSAISSSTLETTDPSVTTSPESMDNQLKLTQSTVENAAKVRDLLDAKWIIWAEFCKLREATYNKLEFLKKPLIDVQDKGMRSLDEAREDIQELTVCFTAGLN